MFRSRLVQLALAGAAVVVVAATLHTITSKPKPPPPVTATVTRGIVLASVSATGNVNADTQLAVNFLNGGLLTEVLVDEGQRVKRGQPLARIDSAPAREKLEAARANVENNQAKLRQIAAGLTPQERQQAQSAIDEAQRALDRAATDLSNTEETRAKDEVTRQLAVDQARVALGNAQSLAGQHVRNFQSDIANARNQLAVDQARLDRDLSRLASDVASVQAARQRELDLITQIEARRIELAAIEEQQRKKKCTTTTSSSTTTTTSPGASTTPGSTTANAAAPSSTSSSSSSSSTTTTTAPADDPDGTGQPNQKECDKLANEHSRVATEIAILQDLLTTARSDRNRFETYVHDDRIRIQDDTRQVELSRQNLINAQNAQAAGLIEDQRNVQAAQDVVTNAVDEQQTQRLTDQQAVEAANRDVATAEATVRSREADLAVKAQPPKPNDLAAQEALIRAAEADLETAARELNDTTLYSPADGTVAIIAAKVGERVAGSGENVSSGSFALGASAPPGALAPGTVSGRSGGFVTLTDLGSLLVKTRFPEADAARIRPGQAANVTFDALSGRTVAAHVATITAIEQVVSNVVNYEVTLILDEGAEGIRPGMTADSAVIVAQRSGVLRLPNAAISPRNNRATVMVLKDGVQVPRQVTTGLKGDDDTEIVAGLSEGDKVVISGGRPGGGPPPPAGR